MKIIFGLLVVAGLLVVVFGSPLARERPVLREYYGAPEKILPMHFAHVDHRSVNCIECHHNYLDDTGDGPCMFCHVTSQELWPLLEDQFHSLCRGCHIDRAARGDGDRPPRQCIRCHLGDDLP